jgi:hypothetical protein
LCNRVEKRGKIAKKSVFIKEEEEEEKDRKIQVFSDEL